MNKERGNTCNSRGITLIALVITIVVLVILVGVTVSTAINSGLIANSKKAVSDYDEVQKQEETAISDVEVQMDLLKSSTAAGVKIGNGCFTGVEVVDQVAESVESFKSKLPGYQIWNSDGETEANAENPVATGMIVKKGEEVVGRVVVIGDVNGTGEIDGDDLTELSRTIRNNQLDKTLLNDYNIAAMDMNNDGDVDGIDDYWLGNYTVYIEGYDPNQSVAITKVPKVKIVSESVRTHLSDMFEETYNLVIDDAGDTYTITVGSGVQVGTILTQIGDSTSKVRIYDVATDSYTEKMDKSSTDVITDRSQIYLNIVDDGYTEEYGSQVVININVE